jgi:hypothetical protein
MHLVLTARRQSQLDELSADLNRRHGTRCEIIPGDLVTPGFPAQLIQTIRDRRIQIDLLINNAGFGYVTTIQNTDLPRVLRLIDLNIRALTELTYLALHDMLARQQGAIINVSSVAGFQPVAYMPAYSASKSYVLLFSEALWAETRDQGVTVLALCPGTTQTDFFEVSGVGGWLKKHRSQTVDQVVKTALKALGRKRQYTVSGWGNYLLAQAVRLASRKLVVLESMKYFRPTPSRRPPGSS